MFLLTLISGTVSQAQDKLSTPERVSNIRLTAIDQTSLEILYDLSASSPGDSIYFEVTGRNSGVLAFNPGFIEGDFGRHVRAGLNKRIVWTCNCQRL